MTTSHTQMQRQREETTRTLTKAAHNFPNINLKLCDGSSKLHPHRAFSTSTYSNGRSMSTAIFGSLLSCTKRSPGVKCLSSSSAPIATTSATSSSVIRPFIGTWILQPDRCQYEFGDPPISGTYTIEAMTDLSDENDDDEVVDRRNIVDRNVGAPKATAATTAAATTTHELRFILEWKEREELLTTNDTDKSFRTEITEAIDGRWHTYYGSGAPNETAVDEVSLGLEIAASSGTRCSSNDGDGRAILLSYGRRRGEVVTSIERQIDLSQNQLVVRQSYFVEEESEPEPESQYEEIRRKKKKKKKKKFTNVSYFVRK